MSRYPMISTTDLQLSVIISPLNLTKFYTLISFIFEVKLYIPRSFMKHLQNKAEVIYTILHDQS